MGEVRRGWYDNYPPSPGLSLAVIYTTRSDLQDLHGLFGSRTSFLDGDNPVLMSVQL